MGKYIIELPDDEHLISWWTYTGTEDGKQHIDFHEVVKTPYKEPDLEAIKQEAYEKGLSDAWDAARKIYLDVNKGGLSVNALTIIFGNKSTNQILKELSVFEAIKKIRQYEHGQEEQIQVGDEINAPFGKAVVVDVDSNAGKIRFVYANGHGGFLYFKNTPTKTGRHFPEIAEVLKKMGIGGQKYD